MTIEQKKYKLIEDIVTVNQIELLDAINLLIKNFSVTQTLPTVSLNRHSNIESTVNINKIKTERPLTPLDMSEFAVEAEQLQWNKSIHELLQELN